MRSARKADKNVKLSGGLNDISAVTSDNVHHAAETGSLVLHDNSLLATSVDRELAANRGIAYKEYQSLQSFL